MAMAVFTVFALVLENEDCAIVNSTPKTVTLKVEGEYSVGSEDPTVAYTKEYVIEPNNYEHIKRGACDVGTADVYMATQWVGRMHRRRTYNLTLVNGVYSLQLI